MPSSGRGAMSALGQKQTSRSQISMSALPPKADIAQHDRDVRFVPKADIGSFIQRNKFASPHSITSSALVVED